MSIDIKIGHYGEPETDKAVFRILTACDEEFYPPLSARTGVISRDLSVAAPRSSAGPELYFQQLKNELLLLAEERDIVVGFMSIRRNFSIEELGRYSPANFVSTVCVDANERGRGICPAFYEFLLNRLPSEHHSPYTATRTWSLNTGHLKVLEKMKFSLVKKIEHDRGEGVHTVYFARDTPHP